MFQTGEGFPLHKKTRGHKDIQITPQGVHGNETAHGGVKGQGPAPTLGVRQKHAETQKDAYSIPHPVPPKITPRARMVPATAPISLLVAMFTVWRENGEFLTKEINYILISLTHNIICSGNALKVKY